MSPSSSFEQGNNLGLIGSGEKWSGNWDPQSKQQAERDLETAGASRKEAPLQEQD